MASKATPSLFQWAAMGSIWSERSLQVKFLNMVWVDRTAVGKMTVSEPRADMTGSAIVREHFPRHEMSCMVNTLFILTPPCALWRA